MSILQGHSPPIGGQAFHSVRASPLISDDAQSVGTKKRLKVFEAISDNPSIPVTINSYMVPPAPSVPAPGRFAHHSFMPPFLFGVVSPAPPAPPAPPVDLAHRPGEPVCPFYQRTGQCRYGVACKFHHPSFSELGIFHPVRPGQPICVYYGRTGGCMYGADCKFHHPPEYSVLRNADGTPIRPVRIYFFSILPSEG